MRTNRRWLALIAVGLFGMAATGLIESQPAAAQPQNGYCLIQGGVPSDFGRPSGGVLVTVFETGQSTTTNGDGRWVHYLPAPGAVHLSFSRDRDRTVTLRLVLDDTCTLIGGAEVAGPPVSMVRAEPALLPGGHRLRGALTIEGRPLPVDSTIDAYIGEQRCASERVAASGRYVIAIAPANAAGCDRAGAPISLVITPPLGDGWSVPDVARFRANADTVADVVVDLRRLPPRPENAAWNTTFWRDPYDIPVGICGPISQGAVDAITAGFRQWREATRTMGLAISLRADSEAACDSRVPGIAVTQDPFSEEVTRDLTQRGIIAVAIALDEEGNPCRASCWAGKVVVGINSPVASRSSVLDIASVIAHEIGHGLGLGHALRCSGGTIMWRDSECRFPLTHIGVDDVASLNAKAATVAPPPARAGTGVEGLNQIDSAGFDATHLYSVSVDGGSIHALVGGLARADWSATADHDEGE